MDTRVLNYRSWIKEGESSNKHLGGFFKTWWMESMSPRKSKWGWRRVDRLDKIPFFCYVRTFISTEVQVLWRVATQLWAFTALHPPAAGGFITLLTQPSRPENWYQQPCWAHDWSEGEGTWQLLLAASKWPRKKRKVPTGRVCCFHRAGDSRERLDYNPCYVFSLLYSQGAAALGWAVSCLLQQGSPSLP